MKCRKDLQKLLVKKYSEQELQKILSEIAYKCHLSDLMKMGYSKKKAEKIINIINDIGNFKTPKKEDST